ncbi:putative cytochrome P450 [Helianthus annuus]|uniref:Cytochrome P450 n=4 Tax=Helianthus annuus TaxID=4232 RepID=A0A9K3IH91_HELAN|nr:3-beta-hydroxylase [Helianthus annuus]KAF5796682.1 putative cytochrome P450 [Helianthus annuus]KAJ0539960.1 putative cytochrome P450 [Helianthus annuus]KAJ0548333.1 putative cytochrome P450 [Helianthus annuus]KAJ0554700.1 putative cytochrome P450 [Helianthus annuus]KAJ0720264.1 putative cytochrome P450 [Helianthus annuus]
MQYATYITPYACKVLFRFSKSINMSFTLQVFIFSSLPFIIALFLLKSYLSSSNSHKNLPPSPRKLPLIGNLHQLGSSPHRAFHAMAQTYGPLMLIRLGSIPVLVVSTVDAAREVMKTHDLVFSNRPNLSIPSRLFYDSKDMAFAPYGEYWRQIKSIAVIHLLSNKRVQSYRHVREEEMSLMMEKIQKSDESVVNISELLISLTNNVICRVALGRRYDGRKFNNLLKSALELLGCFSVGAYIPSLRWVDQLSGLERRVDKVAKEFDEFLEGVLEEHVNKNRVDVKCEDLVDVLLEIQRDNMTGFPLEDDMIKALILDIFMAGTDTTFTSLEWTLCELLRHPQAMKELQQEALKIGQGRSMITEDQLEKMVYLKAVLKETLRLHTPIPLLVPRESTQDVELLGYDIPSGTQVIINAWAISRDPSKWEASEEFRPERFLNNPIDYKGFHFELIPFGAGRRGCPAIQFAMIINQLVLANLVYKFDLVVMEKDHVLDMSETSGLTVHKKRPILVSATPIA